MAKKKTENQCPVPAEAIAPTLPPENFKSNWVFSKRSRARLGTCAAPLQRVIEEALATSKVDFTVICGHRSKVKQDAAVAEGRSKAVWPKSKHNSQPSRAVDIAPWIDGDIPWNDLEAFVALADHVKATAERLGVKIRWGGDWDQDGDWKDERFFDGPHFELL